MELNVTYEPANEEVTIVVDDATVLRVTVGKDGGPVLDRAFQDLEEENPDLYSALHNIAVELLKLQDL